MRARQEVYDGQEIFHQGAAVLAGAGLFAKFLGAVFRIPLTYLIGSEGMGLYQMAYPIYSFLLVTSSAGLPVAISKMVSEKIALDDYAGAQRFQDIFAFTCRYWHINIGAAVFIQRRCCKGCWQSNAVYSILAIAPACSLFQLYHPLGIFQNAVYESTAISQVIEQMGKLILGLWLASYWVKRGVEFGAAGAMLGVTLSEVMALALLLGIYRRKNRNPG